MAVNFRAHKINRGMCKLPEELYIKKKKEDEEERYSFVKLGGRAII
jgi:hypothetical protein